MPDNYINLYVHLIWATWDRLPMIVDRYEWEIQAEIKRAAACVGSDILAVGGMPDHIHVLTTLPATIALADLVKKIKGPSSHFANHALGYGGAFKWQGAYACFSVSDECLPRIRTYIGRQREHHEAGNIEPALEITSLGTSG
jgi:REP element-mobilizing transposase RayT